VFRCLGALKARCKVEWLKLPCSAVRSDAYIGAEPEQRAAWLGLLVYCADQENGGIIPDCADWKDRRWMQTAGVMRSEVHTECDLWAWEGEALRLEFYPVKTELELQAKRSAGAAGGKKSKRSKQLNKQLDKQCLSQGISTRDKHSNNRREETNKINKINSSKEEETPLSQEKDFGTDNHVGTKNELTRNPLELPDENKHIASGNDPFGTDNHVGTKNELTRNPLELPDENKHIASGNDPFAQQFDEHETTMRKLMAVGCKGFVQNREHWIGLVAEHGIDLVLAAAKKTDASNRWSSDVERTIQAKQDGAGHLSDLTEDDDCPI